MIPLFRCSHLWVKIPCTHSCVRHPCRRSVDQSLFIIIIVVANTRLNSLMLDQISDVSRPSDIRHTLEQAPHDLAKMIRHVFERLAGDPGVQKEDFNEMLTWITFARTPLLLGQMDVILKLRGELGEGMPDLEDRLRDQFSSFFTLDREDKMTTESLQLATRDGRHEIISHEEYSSDQAGESHDMHQTVEDPEEDDSGSRIYNSDFSTTLLGFSHASIRDYLVQEGSPTTRKYPVDLGIGSTSTKQSTTSQQPVFQYFAILNMISYSPIITCWNMRRTISSNTCRRWTGRA